MCRSLSLDFEYSLECPVDKQNRIVKFQAHAQLRGHALEVVGCDVKSHVDQLTCGKACRGLLERGEYWQRTYSETASYSGSQ